MDDFRAMYVRAMRDRAPKMFQELRRKHLLDRHVEQKRAEAGRMFKELTKDVPKLRSGDPEQPFAAEAEALVLETFLEFPDEQTVQ